MSGTVVIVPVWRLHLLRAMYLLVVVGLGIVVWPGVIDRAIHQGRPWELMQGVVACMLAAFSALSVLGLRYPLQMLPLLLWEMLWKVIWLSVVALPLWRTGQLDGSTAEITAQCLLVVVIPFVMPWRYVAANYLRWRKA